MRIQSLTSASVAVLTLLFAAMGSKASHGQAPPRTAVVIVSKASRHGTGFIIKIDGRNAYILTASHVIEGGGRVLVSFYPPQHSPFAAKILDLEGGDPKGLALLQVRGDLPAGISELDINGRYTCDAGSPVQILGIASGDNRWQALDGQAAGHAGREVLIKPSVDQGFSGGPAISEGSFLAMTVGTDAHEAVGVFWLSVCLYVWGVNRYLLPHGLPGVIERPTISNRPAAELLDRLSRGGIRNLTRYEAAESIYQAFPLLAKGVPDPPRAAPFPDVKLNDPHLKAIYVLKALGIVIGDPAENGKFAGERTVTRYTLAMLLDRTTSRLSRLRPGDRQPLKWTAESFNDVDRVHWALQAVEALRDKGIAIGSPDQFFHGKRVVTTQGFAATLLRMMQWFQPAN